MRKTIAVTLLAVLTALLGGAGPRVEAAVKVGEISPNFTITDRKSGQPVSLYDYRGSIVVLDFFAYWCGPCVSSSPDLEQNVAKYYKQQGGNPSGVPVAILGVNIEQANPAQTDAFVAKSGMERVANDFQRQAWNLYNTAN
ncbi:MAG: TlpA family protein disulfide reductase, partial [Verrucomicrobiota bacterium]